MNTLSALRKQTRNQRHKLFCTYISMYIRIYASMYICMDVCVHIFIYVSAIRVTTTVA